MSCLIIIFLMSLSVIYGYVIPTSHRLNFLIHKFVYAISICNPVNPNLIVAWRNFSLYVNLKSISNQMNLKFIADLANLIYIFIFCRILLLYKP